MIKAFKMEWARYQYKIEDNSKIVRLPNEPAVIYDLYDFYVQDNSSLYLKFAAININNHEDILDFINKYGFLGLNIRDRFERAETLLEQLTIKFTKQFFGDTQLNNVEELKSISKEAFSYMWDDDVLSYESLYEESLKSISDEITKFNNLLILIDQKDTTEKEELYQLLFNASDDYSRYFFEIDKNEYTLDKLKVDANQCIRDTINKELGQVSPILSFDDSKFDTIWNTRTLISALYTMLYLNLVQGKKLRKCKNITCNEFFNVTNDNTVKKFCDSSCARANAARDYRRREKIKRKKV